jgi:hypothetical protein
MSDLDDLQNWIDDDEGVWIGTSADPTLFQLELKPAGQAGGQSASPHAALPFLIASQE